jgi:hypothetical protein
MTYSFYWGYGKVKCSRCYGKITPCFWLKETSLHDQKIPQDIS